MQQLALEKHQALIASVTPIAPPRKTRGEQQARALDGVH